MPELDPGIAELVAHLQSQGFDTFSSCDADHEDCRFAYPTVRIRTQDGYDFRAQLTRLMTAMRLYCRALCSFVIDDTGSHQFLQVELVGKAESWERRLARGIPDHVRLEFDRETD